VSSGALAAVVEAVVLHSAAQVEDVVTVTVMRASVEEAEAVGEAEHLPRTMPATAPSLQLTYIAGQQCPQRSPYRWQYWWP
jgi:hypothetical protein